MKRKNILLITSDQQRWDTIGVYSDIIKTPNIDRLSAEGITFDKAYTTNPTCTPASQSMQSLIDLPSTFLDMAGIELPVFQQGLIQSEAWIDAEVSCRDWALVESRPTDASFMQKVFYYENWKLVIYTDEAYGELYDMTADPEQYDNLYDNPEYANVRMKLLRKLITAEMEKEGVRRPRVAVA